MAARLRDDWQERAVQVAQAIPVERLHRECMEWIDAHPRKNWVAAFSGGADSLLLLLLLWAHFPKQRSRLVAVHFNHRLRGAESGEDQKFCRVVCAQLQIPLRIGTWENRPPNPSEATARTARHAFFARELSRARSNALWLGHQQEDVAETLLMRLARGSGTAGLSAPRPVQLMARSRYHLRPLLDLKKADIVDALRQNRVQWREDSTNFGDKFFRNRVRNEVLPVWAAAAVGRDAISGAALSRQLLADDDDALEAWLDEADVLTKAGDLDRLRLAGKPRALVRRAIHRWLALQPERVELSRQAFTALLDDVMAARVTQHSVGVGLFAKLGSTKIFLQRTRQKKSGGFQKRVN